MNDAGISHLKGLTKLGELGLSDTQISDPGLARRLSDRSELSKPDRVKTAVWVLDNMRHDIEAILIE